MNSSFWKALQTLRLHLAFVKAIKRLFLQKYSLFEASKKTTRVTHYEELDKIRSLEFDTDYESIKDNELAGRFGRISQNWI